MHSPGEQRRTLTTWVPGQVDAKWHVLCAVISDLEHRYNHHQSVTQCEEGMLSRSKYHWETVLNLRQRLATHNFALFGLVFFVFHNQLGWQWHLYLNGHFAVKRILHNENSQYTRTSANVHSTDSAARKTIQSTTANIPISFQSTRGLNSLTTTPVMYPAPM